MVVIQKGADMKIIKVGDIVVIAVILLLTTVSFCFRFFQQDNGESVSISVGGEETIYLMTENRKIDIGNNNIELTVIIEIGSIYVERSTCNGNDCVKMGKISRNGGVIACAPAEVFVKITKKGANDYDYVIG